MVALANLGVGLTQVFASADRVLDLLDEEPVTADVIDGTDTALNGLLETLLAHKPFLNALAAKCQITLRLYVRSSRAHITYSLMPATLQKLTEVGLPLELSSLSWGEFGV